MTSCLALACARVSEAEVCSSDANEFVSGCEFVWAFLGSSRSHVKIVVSFQKSREQKHEKVDADCPERSHPYEYLGG